MRNTVTIAICVFTCAATWACGSTPSEGEQDTEVDVRQDDADADTTTDDASPDDASPDDASPDDASTDVNTDVSIDPDALDTADDAPPGCSGSATLCSEDCAGDFFETASCVDERWVCPGGTTAIDDCPSGSCLGLPLPGEVCDDGFQCRPWANGLLGDCPTASQMLCADCRGFENAYVTQTCSCSCTGGNVVCEPLITACEMTAESTLPGVSIRFPEQPCIFTLEQVAAGVPIPYELVVEETVDVSSEALDAGGCGRFDLPLNVLPRIAGNGESYCNCDVGFCAGVVEFYELAAGTYSSSIEWTGRNWSGESDTGNPLGEPFPPGSYSVTLRAVGERLAGDGVADYAVEATLAIELIE